jgi:hypothetical protein
MENAGQKLELQRKLERYREMLQIFPAGPTGEMIREYIEHLEQQLDTGSEGSLQRTRPR